MRLEQTLSLVILISYILYDFRKRSLFKVFDSTFLSEKARTLTSYTCFLRFVSMLIIAITVSSLVLLLFTNYASDFYLLDLTTLPLAFVLFTMTSVDLSLARARDDVSYELLLKLLQSLVYGLTFLVFILFYNVSSLEELINIQNSTYIIFPKWNVFILAPLAYVFIDNSQLLMFRKITGTSGEVLFGNLYDFFLKLVVIVSFMILFMGGLFGFGNIDKLITHPRLLDLVQFILAFLKLTIVVAFLNRARVAFPVLTRGEKVTKSIRNIIICILVLLLVLVMKVFSWI